MRAEYQSHQDGFYSATLHRRLALGSPVTMFNRAEWRDGKAFARTLNDFDETFPVATRIGGPSRAVRSLPGLFQIVDWIEGT